MGKWIKKVSLYTHEHIHTCTHMYNDYSAIKKRKKFSCFVTTWVNLEGVTLSGVSRKRQILCAFIYMWKKKKTKVKQQQQKYKPELIDTEHRLVIAMGWGTEGNK